MASFQMSHKGVSGFSQSNMQPFKDVEKAIQKQASAVVPNRRRRRTNNRKSRHEATPLSRETTDGPGVGGPFTPSEERTLRGVKGNRLRSHSRGRERTPRPSQPPFRRPSSSPPPLSMSSRHTTMGNPPATEPFSNTARPRMGERELTDYRVRDDGQTTRIEVGKGPRRVIDSAEQSPTRGTHAKVNTETEMSRESRPQSANNPELRGHRERASNHTPKSSAGEGRGDEVESSSKEGENYAGCDVEKWRPVPPFNYEDGKQRRHPKMPRGGAGGGTP